MGFLPELITKDVHSQAGVSIDLILKSSLKRQAMDNITCVMLTFEGFESEFKNAKNNNNKNYTNDKKESIASINNHNDVNGNNNISRKIKTANGMIRKPICLAKNMTSSFTSNDVKELSSYNNSIPVQNIPSTSTNKNSNNISNKLSDAFLKYNNTNKDQINNNNNNNITNKEKIKSNNISNNEDVINVNNTNYDVLKQKKIYNNLNNLGITPSTTKHYKSKSKQILFK